jgi:hypothetical protein
LSIMKNMQQNGKFDPELFESFMNFIKKFGIYKDDTVQSLEFKELETKRNTFFYTDNLTNLLNREALVSLLKKSHDYDYDVSLIICNIKKFKLYNQQYGLTKGDALLKNIAQQLQERLDVQTTMKEPQYKDLFAFRPSLEKMKNLRDKDLPQLLKDYEVKPTKQKQIIEHVSKRTLQGAL